MGNLRPRLLCLCLFASAAVLLHPLPQADAKGTPRRDSSWALSRRGALERASLASAKRTAVRRELVQSRKATGRGKVVPVRKAPVPDVMACAGWSGPGLCNRNAQGWATVGAFNGTIGGLAGVSQYQHGVFTAYIKFPQVSSKGVVVAFYLIDTTSQSNKDDNHFEIDSEFYGSDDPTKIMLATNVFFAGYQNLAQFELPFNTAATFHKFTMIWNAKQITWLINDQPIRVLFKPSDGGQTSWPNQPLLPMFTVWPINWGDERADYSHGAIMATISAFQFQGCAFADATSPSDGCPNRTGFQFPWNKPLSLHQLAGLTRTKDGAVLQRTVLNDWGWDHA